MHCVDYRQPYLDSLDFEANSLVRVFAVENHIPVNVVNRFDVLGHHGRDLVPCLDGVVLLLQKKKRFFKG